jgi:hypothetical protein
MESGYYKQSETPPKGAWRLSAESHILQFAKACGTLPRRRYGGWLVLQKPYRAVPLEIQEFGLGS